MKTHPYSGFYILLEWKGILENLYLKNLPQIEFHSGKFSDKFIGLHYKLKNGGQLSKRFEIWRSDWKIYIGLFQSAILTRWIFSTNLTFCFFHNPGFNFFEMRLGVLYKISIFLTSTNLKRNFPQVSTTLQCCAVRRQVDGVWLHSSGAS